MNWLQKTCQVNDLQQMLILVAQGIGDVGAAAQYVSNLAPAPSDVCEMINTVGHTYPGSESSMGRIARAAGCQFDPSAENQDMTMQGLPGMNPSAPIDKSMEIPSIEID